MAYAAVISLKQTINGLLESSCVSLSSTSREILEFAYNETTSLQRVVEKLNGSSSERLDDLEGRMRDCAHQLEDVVEFYESCSNYEDDDEVRQEISSFIERVKKMEVEYIQELSKSADKDIDAAAVSSYTDFGVEMVGNFNEYNSIGRYLLRRMRPVDLCFFSLLGEVHSGIAFVAKAIFEELGKGKQHGFNCCVWVTIGKEYESKEVVMRILAQVDNLAGDYERLVQLDDEELCNYLSKVLEHRVYMIVLDDVHDEVAQSAYSLYCLTGPRHFFEESIWLSTRAVIFGLESISPELEEAGKKIIQNCRGLYISAAKALLFLCKTEVSVEQWSKIAADKENPIFNVEDEISEIRKIKKELQPSNWDMDGIRDKAIVEMISTRINFYDSIEEIKKNMHPERFFSKMETISLLGMAGIGKTTFARKNFKHKSILCNFDYRVWVTLGPDYQAGEILVDILAQIYPSIDKMRMKEDEKLARDLCVPLSSKRGLIVMDDVCSKEPLHHLKILFPEIKGRALVTTRLAKVAKVEAGDDVEYQIRFLNKEESWDLLRQKVFPDGLCPPELRKAGRKIAENCEGLPLLILRGYEIPTSKLTNLWAAEGFLEPNLPQNIEDFVAECLSELVDRSLNMVQCKVSNFQIKTCRFHSVFWHLSNSQALKNNFFHAMSSYADCSMESIKSQRRLCIRNSILLGMRDVQDLMSSCTSTHSLLCVSPPHRYPVPICFDMRLLRVMDALTIRLYEFPVEVVELIHLRYLGLTCHEKLPTSISNLQKLQHLIVMGGRLPNPKCGNGLPKLSTLLDVSAQSCTKKVLKSIPNLKRLGIRIELAPDDEGNGYPFRCLNRISHLRKLESLKCVVVNPDIGSDAVAPPAPISMFPSSLKKLSLSGLGYPWEYMSIIGKLKNLEVLKLKRYAFRGSKWSMDHDSLFDKLKFLLVEETNLVSWEVKSCITMQLERLSIKHCYELQELPIVLQFLRFTKIEIVDCNPSTVAWAEQIRPLIGACEVEAYLSWFRERDQ
ncbi:hypothetical protein C2S51_003090 [Perilla frutescens var. frutescens]|nr:hypothetical protein C2S51_003090 [Perilla frutescens var. frutescens]